MVIKKKKVFPKGNNLHYLLNNICKQIYLNIFHYRYELVIKKFRDVKKKYVHNGIIGEPKYVEKRIFEENAISNAPKPLVASEKTNFPATSSNADENNLSQVNRDLFDTTTEDIFEEENCKFLIVANSW